MSNLSWNNFSKRDRANKDKDYNNKYDKLTQGRKTNEQSIDNVKNYKERWKSLISYFRSYPDMFLEFISDGESKINLYFFQRVYLRILCRHKNVFITATRGTSKSYLQNLAMIIVCILYPNTRRSVVAPTKSQASNITQEKLRDIFEHFPELKKEVKHYRKEKDFTELEFYNGSIFNVVTMSSSSRGGRRHGMIVEEICDDKFDEGILNSVVIPMMSNNRMAVCKQVDKSEVLHKSQWYVTTASPKQNFANAKASEVLEQMENGESAFFIGNSYELPCMHDLLEYEFVESMRNSPTVSQLDFLREYCSVYTGSSTDALVQIDVLKKCRNLKVAEWEAVDDPKVMYALAYDVARNEGDANALSALIVIKCTPRNDGTYLKEIVNVFSMEGMHDTYQARFLKQKVEEFRASILVIDANGLGSGVVDQCVLDLGDGYPPYKVVNDEDRSYDRYYTEESIPMVFALKAQSKETKNSDMINHIYKVFNKKDVSLLINPQDGAKEYTKFNKIKYTALDSEERMKYEMPYIYTDLLIDELLNLRYKQTGNGQAQIERVSRSICKDKYSALLYGLFWVYLQERKNLERKRKSTFRPSKLSTLNRRPTAYKN